MVEVTLDERKNPSLEQN